jgi:hypothetical protein
MSSQSFGHMSKIHIHGLIFHQSFQLKMSSFRYVIHTHLGYIIFQTTVVFSPHIILT